MSDKKQDSILIDTFDAPVDPQRRRLLGGMVIAGAALAAGGAVEGKEHAAHAVAPKSQAELDVLLQKHIQHVVVIYAENRSFNNLFADFPGVERPLSSLRPEDYRQVDRDGSVLETLPPIWGGLVQHEQTVNHRRYLIGEKDIAGLANMPFALHTPDGDPLPHGLVTRDLWHSFYQNQLQINGGKNDGFVAWGDSGALVMGYYGDAPVNLRLWRLAKEYTLCDRFFMGTFGGSFLNHQYLVAARPPFYPNADKSPAWMQIAQVEGDDPKGIRLKQSEDSPHSAMHGKPKFASRSALSPDFWVVNTMGPPYAPTQLPDPDRPELANAKSPNTLPPQSHTTIGDVLSAKGVSWAWYAGGWQVALDGRDSEHADEFPQRPNFQVHHQPLNYFSQLAPGTEARKEHLRDGGMGDVAPGNRFVADAEAGKLPQVTFYKPQGDLNMHSGYSDVDAGDRHIAHIVEALRKCPQWKSMAVIVTFDENGGWWDHVAPPKGDRWGPGSRVPTLVISPFAKRGHVEHTMYDTGSIARFITRRFGLEKLPGLLEREQAMLAAGGVAPGDLTETLQFA
ncbi:MAG TPA: acid phosphatase [Dyella sp.]|uniref:acid phosphatase n=1 Tax=Dyella sp. TaxID=1869338 RepID=UPI002F949424